MSQGVAVRNDSPFMVTFETSWNNSGLLWKGRGSMMSPSAHPFRKLCKAGLLPSQLGWGLKLHVACGFDGREGVGIPCTTAALTCFLSRSGAVLLKSGISTQDLEAFYSKMKD